MFAYRLCQQEHARLLDGNGSAKYGGRWNSRGVPMVYAAENRSLAILEYCVDGSLEDEGLVIVTLKFPDDSLQVLKSEELPDQWVDLNPESLTVPIGDLWLKEQKTLVMKVPSVVVPQECNILINPLHPRMPEVRIADEQPFRMDQRVL